METWIRIALTALAVIALNGCGPKAPEFEVLGITLDATTLESAQKVHPSMQCDRLTALIIVLNIKLIYDSMRALLL